MSAPTDGGPAFPRPADATAGQTLRDYFAAHALVGLLSGRPGAIIPTEWAGVAYLLADAMLAARTQEPGA